MRLRQWLESAKAAELKHAAFLIGLPTTGTKSQLQGLLHAQLRTRQHERSFGRGWESSIIGPVDVHSIDSEATPRKPDRTILSIDMGIRNLAICVFLMPGPKAPNDKRKPENESPPLEIVDWKKIDILALLSCHENVGPLEKTLGRYPKRLDPTQPSQGDDDISWLNVRDKFVPSYSAADLEDAASKAEDDRKRNIKHGKPSIPAAAFSPANLSHTALDLTRHFLKYYQPEFILIERQRFRSGGASAVQEWTLRVNMLESMLWSSLMTMRYHHNNQPLYGPGPQREIIKRNVEAHEMSPARVAKFWCSGLTSKELRVGADFGKEGTARETPTLKTGKIEKKDKIDLVKSWVKRPRDASWDEGIRMRFHRKEVAAAFRKHNEKRKTRSKTPEEEDDGKEAVGGDVGKLDDLADCLLQGAAWVRWRENRKRMRESFPRETAEEAKNPPSYELVD